MMKLIKLAMIVFLISGGGMGFAAADDSKDRLLQEEAAEKYFYDPNQSFVDLAHQECASSYVMAADPSVSDTLILSIPCGIVEGNKTVIRTGTNEHVTKVCKQGVKEKSRGGSKEEFSYYNVKLVPDNLYDPHEENPEKGLRYCLVSPTKGQCFTIPKKMVDHAVSNTGRLSLELGDGKIPLELAVMPIEYGSKKRHIVSRPYLLVNTPEENKRLLKIIESRANRRQKAYYNEIEKNLKGKSDLSVQKQFLPLEDVSPKEIQKMRARNIQRSLEITRYEITDHANTISKLCKAYFKNNQELQPIYCTFLERNRQGCPFSNVAPYLPPAEEAPAVPSGGQR